MYSNAIEIYKGLVERDSIYETDLAASLYNIGCLLFKWYGKKKAAPFLKQALEIYKRLEAENPGKHRDMLKMIKSLI
jgi:hypothetical protein